MSFYDNLENIADAWHADRQYESATRQQDDAGALDNWRLKWPGIDNRVSQLPHDSVLTAFESVVDGVRKFLETSRDSSIAHRLLFDLEEAMRRDRAERLVSHLHNLEQIVGECQQLFRHLAEVSSQRHSRPLGLTLFRFFMQNVRWIAGTSTSMSLCHWCQSILRAEMDVRSKHECLNSVVRLHLELFDSFDYPRRRDLTTLQNLLRELMGAGGVHGNVPDVHQRPQRNGCSCRQSEEFSGEDLHRTRTIEDGRLSRLKGDVKFHEEQARRGKQRLLHFTESPVDQEFAHNRKPLAYAQTGGSTPSWWQKCLPVRGQYAHSGL